MLISKFGTVSEEQISEYEDVMGISLPKAYRDFICKYNGGETPNTNFKSENISSDIKVFYGIGDVKHSLNGIKTVDYKGISCLPIALDSFGNEILIKSTNGEVLFKDHENDSIKSIASDFSGFVALCKSAPINSASIKSVADREKELIERGRGNIISEALKELWRAEIKKYTSLSLEEVII